MPAGSAPLRTDFQTVTTTTKGYGRLKTHMLTTISLLNATSHWPHLGQVFQLLRDVRHLKLGKTSHKVVAHALSLESD